MLKMFKMLKSFLGLPPFAFFDKMLPTGEMFKMLNIERAYPQKI